MVMLAVGLFVAGVLLVAVGFVLFANGTGAVPRERTEHDRTGIKRAASRTPWSGVFRDLPANVRVLAGQKASREDKLAAAGSLFLLTGVAALALGVLSLVVAHL